MATPDIQHQGPNPRSSLAVNVLMRHPHQPAIARLLAPVFDGSPQRERRFARLARKVARVLGMPRVDAAPAVDLRDWLAGRGITLDGRLGLFAAGRTTFSDTVPAHAPEDSIKVITDCAHCGRSVLLLAATPRQLAEGMARHEARCWPSHVPVE